MKVLVACEFSGVVRDAFRARGHQAVSCDLVDSQRPDGLHLKMDVRDAIRYAHWDLMIAFPPCTYLCASGMHWTVRGFRDPKLTQDALEFVEMLLDAPINHIALENPIGVIGTRLRPYTQLIHPWQFGHPESKATCLWLKNLPKLVPTKVLPKPACGYWRNQTPAGQSKVGETKRRAAQRAITYEGIAEAMAEQWSL